MLIKRSTLLQNIAKLTQTVDELPARDCRGAIFGALSIHNVTCTKSTVYYLFCSADDCAINVSKTSHQCTNR